MHWFTVISLIAAAMLALSTEPARVETIRFAGTGTAVAAMQLLANEFRERAAFRLVGRVGAAPLDRP
jgi:hypothetical protein